MFALGVEQVTLTCGQGACVGGAPVECGNDVVLLAQIALQRCKRLFESAQRAAHFVTHAQLINDLGEHTSASQMHNSAVRKRQLRTSEPK